MTEDRRQGPSSGPSCPCRWLCLCLCPGPCLLGFCPCFCPCFWRQHPARGTASHPESRLPSLLRPSLRCLWAAREQRVLDGVPTLWREPNQVRPAGCRAGEQEGCCCCCLPMVPVSHSSPPTPAAPRLVLAEALLHVPCPKGGILVGGGGLGWPRPSMPMMLQSWWLGGRRRPHEMADHYVTSSSFMPCTPSGVCRSPGRYPGEVGLLGASLFHHHGALDSYPRP